MSKIKSILLSILCCCFALSLPVVPLSANAEKEIIKQAFLPVKTEQQVNQEIKSELEGFIEFGIQTKERQSRFPGSEAEFKSAMYLQQKMNALSTFNPVNDASTINGVQSFNFKSLVDGLNYTSQNIIFRKDSAIDTNKKVVFGAHYDSTFVYTEETNKQTGEQEIVSVVSDGINDNAAGVALLLTLAKNLDIATQDFGFDIEIVFFGASTNNYDGSTFYNKGKTQEECNDILLMINFDKVAIGKYIYAYVNEFESSQEEFLHAELNKASEFKKLDNFNTLDIQQQSPNGLNYSHIGLESDHAKFMERSVNVLNFFSGDYELPLAFGLNEYNAATNVTYSKNDSYAYLNQNHQGFVDKLVAVYNGVGQIISSSNFIDEMQKENNIDELYAFWTNEKLAAFITAILLIVFIVIYVIIYHTLLKKSKKTLKDKDIDKIVIKIATNLGDADKKLNDIIDEKISDDVEKE